MKPQPIPSEIHPSTRHENIQPRGILVPLITPLLAQDELDANGLERLIEHVIAGGVYGIFILGTTGEGTSLSFRLRLELIEHTCRQANHRVPVFVGITDTSMDESTRLAHHAEQAGADAVVLSTPYYYPLTQSELLHYTRTVVSQVSLPVFLYNIPGNTKVEFGVETLRALTEIPLIRGVKDSSGDMNYLKELIGVLQQRPDWSILVGPEELLEPAVFLGAHGGVCGGANLFPQLYVDLYQAASRGDQSRSNVLQNQVRRLAGHLYHHDQYSTGVIKGLKIALACRGICSDYVAPPLSPYLPQSRHAIIEFLEQFEQENHAFPKTNRYSEKRDR